MEEERKKEGLKEYGSGEDECKLKGRWKLEEWLKEGLMEDGRGEDEGKNGGRWKRRG